MTDATVEDPDQRDNAEEVVEPGVDDQRLERRIRGTFGSGDLGNERFQQRTYASAGLGAHAQDSAGVDANDVLDFRRHAGGVGLREVDLVEYGQDFEALFYCRVAIGDRLRFDALGSVYHEQCALARGEGTGDFVAEVDVSGGVDEVQLVGLAVLRGVVERDALRLDGDASFALEVHRVEHLVRHFTLAQGVAQLDEAVRERGLAVVDVGDDREVADVGRAGHVRRSTRTSSVPRWLWRQWRAP